MLFPRHLWPKLADGSVTVAFRRWKRPSVRTGGTLHSPVGLLAIDEVAPIGIEEITDIQARAAGYEGSDEILASLRPEGELYRIRFHRLGEDPRIELRDRSRLDETDLAEIGRALARSPWAVPVLRLIAERPGVVSTELAPAVGMDRFPFKQRVRRLKALGLTESLKVGYRLSPRGQAYLSRLDSAGRPATGAG